MKPIDPHQDDSLTEDATEDDRFAALVAAEARGEPVSPGDAAFRRRYEEIHPDATAEAGLWAALGTLGDTGEPPAGLGDADLLARVLQRASTPIRPTAARRRGVAVTVTAVALAATLMVAFAAELRARWSTLGAPLAAATGSAPQTPSVPVTTGEPPRPPVAAPSVEPTPVELGAAPALPVPAPIAAPAPITHLEATHRDLLAPSADELLRRAQDHLGGGRAREAVEAYRELVARYPASGEGRAALISLGRLALDDGHGAEALGYLDRYLRSPGPLDEEARYWRIEALRRLGRFAAEAAAIDEVLAHHPASVHAERLRTRAGSGR